MTSLLKKLNDPDFLKKLNDNNEVSGYQSPNSGKITYNKIVDKSNFGYFSDIITSIAPTEYIYDSDEYNNIPSIAKTLIDLESSTLKIYNQYLILNTTPDNTYMDYEDEEDQENMSALLSELDAFPLKTAIAGVAVQKSEAMQSAHAIAFITWKISKNKYKFAFYDSLAYKRGKNKFNYTEYAFVPDRFEENIEFIDLNKYCFKSSEENFHCSQYVMNSEYCYVYAVFFLFKWIEFGAKLHRATFKKTIIATYIVEPVKLTRANNKESMIYRVIMMQFICKTFLNFLKDLSKDDKKLIKKSSNNITRIKKYLLEFKQKYGFNLLKD
jgi:hypothetical protein